MNSLGYNYIRNTLSLYLNKPLRIYPNSARYAGSYADLPETSRGYIGILKYVDNDKLVLGNAERYYTDDKTIEIGDRNNNFTMYYDDISSVYDLSGRTENKILGGSNKGGKKQNKSKKQRKSKKRRKSRKNKSK
jgi:hypothetical protein